MAVGGRLVLAFGKTGGGKTYWTGHRIKGRRRVLVYDPTGELVAETGESYVHVNTLAKAARAVRWICEQRPKGYRVRVSMAPRQVEAWMRCLEMLWDTRAARATVVIDEADEVAEAGKRGDGFERFLRYSRRYTDETVLVGQRLAGMPMKARTNCWLHVQFETAEWNDYKAIRERWGPEAEAAVRELATGAEHRHVQLGRGATGRFSGRRRGPTSPRRRSRSRPS